MCGLQWHSKDFGTMLAVCHLLMRPAVHAPTLCQMDQALLGHYMVAQRLVPHMCLVQIPDGKSWDISELTLVSL